MKHFTPYFEASTTSDEKELLAFWEWEISQCIKRSLDELEYRVQALNSHSIDVMLRALSLNTINDIAKEAKNSKTKGEVTKARLTFLQSKSSDLHQFLANKGLDTLIFYLEDVTSKVHDTIIKDLHKKIVQMQKTEQSYQQTFAERIESFWIDFHNWRAHYSVRYEVLHS
jgi:hypothetical protein